MALYTVYPWILRVQREFFTNDFHVLTVLWCFAALCHTKCLIPPDPDPCFPMSCDFVLCFVCNVLGLSMPSLSKTMHFTPVATHLICLSIYTLPEGSLVAGLSCHEHQS